MENEQDDEGTGRPNPSREIKFSGANGDREIFSFPLQLTASRIGNYTRLIHALLGQYSFFPVYLVTSRIGSLTRLIHTLLHVVTIHALTRMTGPDLRGYMQFNKYIHSYSAGSADYNTSCTEYLVRAYPIQKLNENQKLLRV